MAARRSSLAPSSISTSRQSSLAYKGCSEPMNDAALQFKLSKKVAELTLVVHMLFTRNHEREVELESTKEAYEQEIDKVSDSYEKEIGRLKTQLDMEKWKKYEEMERLSKEGDENTRKLLERHDKKFSELSAENEKLKSSYRGLDERYKRASEDHEQARCDYEALAKERAAKDRAMLKDHQRIEKLQQNARVNKELMEKMKENIHNIQKSVNHKVSQMEANNRSASEVSEQLRIQNEQLETENRNLRKKVTDQGSQIRRMESNPNMPVCASSIASSKLRLPPKSVDSDITKDEEIERLKREVQKYRLELSNREENFNKIFSDIKPVMVRNGGMSCVKELRDERIDTARSNEIPIYSYKHTRYTKSTLRLRSKLGTPAGRSLLPSLSSPPAPAAPPSTRGERGKYSLLSEPARGGGGGGANQSPVFLQARDANRPIRSRRSDRGEAISRSGSGVGRQYLRPKTHEQAKNGLTDVRWLFGKKPTTFGIENNKVDRGVW